jgi:transposase
MGTLTPGQLYASGLGLRECAKQFRVSHETVRTWLEAEGVTMRPEPPWLRPKITTPQPRHQPSLGEGSREEHDR